MTEQVFVNPLVRTLIELALDEDRVFEDHTGLTSLPHTLKAHAQIIAREKLLVCGLPIIYQILHVFDGGIQSKVLVDEGCEVQASSVLVELQGSARSLLALERTFLNFLQRLSGVATFTKQFIGQSKLKVYDTRKTLPGWRLLDKYATKIGGACNHRLNLSELIMIKDTHIAANGGVAKALNEVFKNKTKELKVEIEVANLSELEQALKFPINIIMLDNFDNLTIIEAVKLIRIQSATIQIEVSGGITSQRLIELENYGIDYVSVGALTTQARNVDIAMEVTLC